MLLLLRNSRRQGWRGLRLFAGLRWPVGLDFFKGCVLEWIVPIVTFILLDSYVIRCYL